ncbi:tyrosine--tRNA ligase, partial [Akkermansiaceae bacterium]|nr:tyrosine--tRNA ligase [Akkermansiaceae bacterium]
FGKLMSISDDLMDRYYLLLLGDARDVALHPMEAKKELACRIVARYHSEDEGEAARGDWETRFSKRDLNAADLPEMAVTDLNGNVLQVVGLVFKEAFSLEKSNGELRKQFITTGAVQLDGDKLIDPMANFHAVAGQVLRLSKKQSIRLV